LSLGRKKRVFSSPKHPNYLWGPLNPIFNGYWGSLLGAKQPWSEVNHSPASSAKVKNEWSYTSTPPDCLKAWTGMQITFVFISASIIIIIIIIIVVVVVVVTKCILFLGDAY
jgi:hypothetical protein